MYVTEADANGRDWRPEVVDTEFDPGSIVEYPVTIFNPDDEVVFVQPGPGLSNNDGIATLWHDHYVIEYTVKSSRLCVQQGYPQQIIL